MTGDFSEIARQAGAWIGPIGGLAGLYTFLASLHRRRLRVAVDYVSGTDLSGSWHRFTVTNRSDLTLTFRTIGPAWFLSTPLGRQFLGFTFDAEDNDPPLTVLGAHTSIEWHMSDDDWQLASPARLRDRAHLRVGVEIPRLGRLAWIKPRRPTSWDLSLRERTIHRLYGLWGASLP